MIGCMITSCTSAFQEADEYLQHLKNHHQVPVVYRYCCTVLACRQIFTNYHSFRKHIRGHGAKSQSNSSLALPIPQQQDRKRDIDTIVLDDTSPLEKKSMIDDDHRNEQAECSSDPLRTVKQHDVMLSSAVKFTLGLHMKSNMNRKDVHNIQRDVTQMLHKIAYDLETMNVMHQNPQEEFNFKIYLDKMKNMFGPIDTDHKLFEYLKKIDKLVLPQIVSIENNKNIRLEQMNYTDTNEEKKNFLVIMPIRHQLKSFLDCNDALKLILSNGAEMEKSTFLKNYVNGKTWKKIREKYGNDIIVPIALYADEFEINDAQGSHSNRHSVCGIYYNLLTLPNEFSSKLKNIFVGGMLKKQDIKDEDINRLIAPLIDVFNDLEENGIDFYAEGRNKTVRFVLSLLTGDNLGIHTMLSLSSGFNATFYCRFCRRPKVLLKNDNVEHADCLRRKLDYDEDVRTNSLSETGIVANSVFNSLPSFHVTQNKSVDPMHDLFSSGVCKYGLTKVLNHCIYVKKYFTLRQLNESIREISKTSINDELRRMPDVQDRFLSREKQKSVVLRMTSSEMLIFTHYFPLIVAKFVPTDDLVWKFCTIMIRLVELCLKSSFSPDDLARLRHLIETHHTLYVQLFNDDLKPKHHFLVHYPTVIEDSGPVYKMMCFRNEAKHRGFKQHAHIMPSRRNVCYTLCVKASLQFAYDVIHGTFLENDTNDGFQMSDIRLRKYFSEFILPLQQHVDHEVMLSSNANYKGTSYRAGNFLTMFRNDVMHLYEIVEFMLLEDSLYLIAQVWEVGQYHEHFLAYDAIKRLSLVDLINIKNFDSQPVSLHRIGNSYMFRVKNNYNDSY